MTSRTFATAYVALALALALALACVGCGDQTPRFDPAINYTADTLAREFLFAYKDLKMNGPAIKSKGPKERPEAATKGGAATTKAAPAATLDGLLKEVIIKAASIPGLSLDEACKKVAEIAVKDPAFSEADKKTITDRLGQVTN